MNKILRFSILALAALGMMSCEDDRELDIPSDGMLFSTSRYEENVAVASVYDGSFTLYVSKSGKGTMDGEVTIKSDPSVVNAYNLANQKEFKAIPSDMYELSRQTLSFRANKVSMPVTVAWDARKMAEYISKGDESNSVIALKLADSDLPIWDETSYVLIKLVKPVVNLSCTDLERTASFDMNFADVQTLTLTMDTKIEADACVSFEYDPSLVDVYNAANGTDYKPAPTSLVQLPLNAVIPAGSTKGSASITIFNKEYYSAFGEEAVSTLLAPIRITSATSSSLPVGIGEDDIIYVIVSGPEYPTPGFGTPMIEWPIFISNYTDKIQSKVTLSSALSGVSSYVSLDVDYSLVEAYNAANGTNFVAGVDGLVNIPSSVEVLPDNTESGFSISIDRNKFSSFSDLSGGVLIPVRMNSLIINGAAEPAQDDDVLYVKLEQPEYREILGDDSWDLLEGEKLSVGWDPSGETATDWYRQQYTSKGLCDGQFGPNVFEGAKGTVWGSWFTNPMEFPLDFVFDMKIPHNPEVIWKYEWFSGQGSFNHLQIYLAEEYDGENTEWNLAFDGNIGPKNYEVDGGAKHSGECQNKNVIGRYLKIRLPECTLDYGAASGCYGYIREIWFEGR